MDNETLHIKEPFKIAGWKYGWIRDGYKQIGIGIKMELLQGEGSLDITIRDNDSVWRLDKNTARNFIEKYESFFTTDMGTILGVVSWDTRLIQKIGE